MSDQQAQSGSEPSASDSPAAPSSAPLSPPPVPPKRPDRWAHRRAEPRPFAFIWILFLIVSCAGTIGAIGMLGLQPPDVYRPSVRLFLALAGAGIIVLWPMVRLCQSTPRSPLAASLQDALVVFIPLQAAIWPQAWRWMAGWPLGVVIVLALVLTGWILGVAALLALAHRDLAWHERTGDQRPRLAVARRAAWMAAFIAIASLGPVLSLALAMGLPPGEAAIGIPLLASPVTAALEIARDRSWSGHPAALTPAHWWAAMLTPALGLASVLIIGLHRRATGSARID